MNKQLSNDITSSGTVRINTVILFIMQMLPKFDVILTADETALGVATLNIAWKVYQKWLRGKK